MGFSRQEHWSELPCPPPGDLPNPRTEPRSPALRADSLSWATREACSLVYNYSNFYPYVLHNIYNSTNMHKLCIMCYILSCIYYLTMYFVRLSIFAQINLPRFPMRLHRTISFHWILLCGPTITYHCTYNEQYYNKHFCIYIFLYTCMCKFLEVAFLGKHVWIFKV